MLDNRTESLSPPLLGGDVEDVISSDEGISVLLLQLPVDILLRLLQGNVHIPVKTHQNTTVIHPRVELDHNRTIQKTLQEIIGILAGTHFTEEKKDNIIRVIT